MGKTSLAALLYAWNPNEWHLKNRVATIKVVPSLVGSAWILALHGMPHDQKVAKPWHGTSHATRRKCIHGASCLANVMSQVTHHTTYLVFSRHDHLDFH
jgi:hypothetical protein